MDDPRAFVFKCDDDNTHVIVKALDLSSANESISKVTDKKLRLKAVYDKWVFVDTTIMSEEEKDNMNETKIEIEKWRKIRDSGMAFLSTHSECGLDCLDKEVKALSEYVKGTAESKLGCCEASLGVDRKPFVPYNPHNL